MKKKTLTNGWVWNAPLTLTPRRQRQVDSEFKACSKPAPTLLRKTEELSQQP